MEYVINTSPFSTMSPNSLFFSTLKQSTQNKRIISLYLCKIPFYFFTHLLSTNSTINLNSPLTRFVLLWSFLLVSVFTSENFQLSYKKKGNCVFITSVFFKIPPCTVGSLKWNEIGEESLHHSKINEETHPSEMILDFQPPLPTSLSLFLGTQERSLCVLSFTIHHTSLTYCIISSYMFPVM